MISYHGNCSFLSGQFVEEVMNMALESCYMCIEENVGVENLRRVLPDYEWEDGDGLKLKDDPEVEYYINFYPSHTYFIIRQRAIEHIWEIDTL